MDERMSWRTLEYAHVVGTRTDHVCYGCSRRWPRGSKMVTWTTVEAGERPERLYLCPICDEFCARYLSDDDELPIGSFVSYDTAAYAEIEGRFDMQLLVIQAGLYFRAAGLYFRAAGLGRR